MSKISSNNTNKLSPQEPVFNVKCFFFVQIIQINLVLKNRVARKKEERKGSNNTNKLSPQEQSSFNIALNVCSNNTNKLSPQER